MVIVTATEFKSQLGKYLDMVSTQDVYITKNGKNIARLTSSSSAKLATLDKLAGIANQLTDTDEATIREERLARQ